jgi:hypothetical protein
MKQGHFSALIEKPLAKNFPWQEIRSSILPKTVLKKSKDVETENANGVHSPVKKASRRKPAAKKPRTKKSAPEKQQPQAQVMHPSDEEIRTRAYFIAERRAHLAIKGDHHSDWIEAKRQLFEEAGLPLS